MLKSILKVYRFHLPDGITRSDDLVVRPKAISPPWRVAPCVGEGGQYGKNSNTVW